jgi:hypothetical protein
MSDMSKERLGGKPGSVGEDGSQFSVSVTFLMMSENGEGVVYPTRKETWFVWKSRSFFSGT